MLADNLSVTSTPLSEKEFVTYLLNGLGPTYETFVTSITTRLDPTSSQELYHLLLIHENHITHNSKLTNPSSPFEPSANLSSTDQRNQRGKSTYRGGRNGRGHGRSSQNRGGRTFLSSSQNLQSNNRPVCQVYNKPGHMALQCHF